MKICTVEGCDKKSYAKNMCRSHYSKQHYLETSNISNRRSKNAAVCVIDECEEKPKSKSLCIKHYTRLLNHGDPNVTLYNVMVNATTYEKFIATTNKDGPIPEMCPELGRCWLWTGHTNAPKNTDYPYGIIYDRDLEKQVLVHRFSYGYFQEDLGPHMKIDHICHNTLCVNPDHLRKGTQKQNTENIKLRSNSTTGVRGVWWNKRYGKYMVQITHNGKKIHGGYFNDLNQADLAARQLRDQYFTFHQDGVDGRLEQYSENNKLMGDT